MSKRRKNTKIEITMETNNTSQQALYSASTKWDYNILCLATEDNQFRNLLPRTVYFGNSIYGSKHTVVTWQDNAILDGEQVRTSSATYTMGYLMPLRLFAQPQWSELQTSSYKLYNFKIYENDTLIRDFIPVKNILNDNKICLYDKVEGKFYYNAGSGEFIAGGVA